MLIDHIAIYVADLEAMKDFYVKYFGCRPNDMYHNPRTGLRSYFLSWDGETRLEIMSRPEVKEGERDCFQQGLIHLSVKVGSKQRVDELTRHIENDGYTVYGQPRVTGDGYYESVILDPEGNMIEITE